jgi:hypothetical protein
VYSWIYTFVHRATPDFSVVGQPKAPAIGEGFFVSDGEEMCIPCIKIVREEFSDQRKETAPSLVPFFEAQVKLSSI